MAIIAVVFLGLTDTSIVALDYSLNNQIREEAVHIADNVMDVARNSPFDNLVGGTTSGSLGRSVRGKSVAYGWSRQVEVLDVNNRRVTVTVSWPSRVYRNGRWQPVNRSHRIVSVVAAGTGMR